MVEGPFGYDAILGSNALRRFGGKLNLGKGRLKFQSSNSLSGGQAGKWVALYPLEDLSEEQLTAVLDKQAQLTNVGKADQVRLCNLLEWNKDVFHIKLERHGASRTTAHHIELTDPTPIRAKERHVSPMVQSKINNKVSQMGSTGVLHLSNSEWAAPVLLIDKKDRDETSGSVWITESSTRRQSRIHIQCWTQTSASRA